MRRLWRNLGKLLDNALKAVKQEFERLIKPVILENPNSRSIIVIAERYLLRSQNRGIRVGWRATNHNISQDEQPVPIPVKTYDTLQEAAQSNVRLLADKLRMYTQQDVTAPQVLAWLSTAGQMQVFAGSDSGSKASATMLEAEYKRWVRAWERKEKRPHSILEGAVIPEAEFFVLPSGGRVYGPRDWDNYPEPGEWINCGHALQFEKRANREELDAGLQVLFRPGAR